MPRPFHTLLIGLALALATLPPLAPGAAGAGAGGAGAAEDDAGDAYDIQALVTALSDEDPAVRNRATQRLAAIGVPARPAVLEALRSGDPEQRARAAEILKALPWDTETDPPAVRALLRRYGAANETGRMRIIRELDEVEGGVDALFRLLREEPGNTPRWMVVMTLWDNRDPAAQKRLRGLDLSGAEAPILLLAGRAWLERDRPRGLRLLREAIDADERQPSGDGGILLYALDELVEAALKSGAFDEAAALLRRQIPRDAVARRVAVLPESSGAAADSPGFAKLIALHTYFGPLRGWRGDLATRAHRHADARAPRAPPAPRDPPAPRGPHDNLGDARDAAHRLLAWFGVAAPLPRRDVQLTPREHYYAGTFLNRHGFLIAARIELEKALASRGSIPDRQAKEILHAETLLALAQVAARRKDDAAAADHLEQAMRVNRAERFGLNERAEDEVWAEIHFRRARVADAKGDAATANARVRDLLQFTPANTDLTLEIIEWMKSTSRGAEARTLFDKVYVQARARLDAADPREIAGLRNDVAWLCGRAGERLDEALELASAAVETDPENAAFLDTLAEVHFQRGDAAEAARLEERALALSPGNEFMQEQLARFRAARK